VKKFPSTVATVWILAGIAAAKLSSAADSMRVDGVPVYGKVRDVSVASIREAIAEATDKRIPSDPKKPRALEIVSRTEMHAYLPDRDLGWVPVRKISRIEPNGREHPAWSYAWWGIDNTPEQLRCLRTADRAYIFPIPADSKPRRDDRHSRLLPPDARRELVRLLGYQKGWFPGSYGGSFSIGPEPKNVGFVFRQDKNELVLFFSAGGLANGTFNGEHTGGLLEEKRGEQFEQWKQRYAQQELATK
jgi:hypothetical protein